MDTFVISQVSFWWTRYKCDPKQIVDKLIELAVDILVPPKDENNEGSSPSIVNGIMKKWNSADRAVEKQERAARIRRELASWDRENPDMKHEMIIKSVVPAFVSALVTSMYMSFCRRIRNSR